jgi:hypothetical protein
MPDTLRSILLFGLAAGEIGGHGSSGKSCGEHRGVA